MATIIINRTNEFSNKWRNYKILIDGQQVGVIANGESKEFITTEGAHTVSAKIDWCSSPDISITVKENQLNNLQVGGFENAKWIVPLGLGVVILNLILSQFMNTFFLKLAIIPVLLIMVYYLSFGRNKYLSLKEI